MKTFRAYRYELEPNDRQRTLLLCSAGTARKAYNWGLARRIDIFRTNEGNARYTDAVQQSKELNAIKKSKFPWMYEVSHCCAQEALWDLDAAFKNFRRERKAGRPAGFPKYRVKGDRDRFRLPTGVRVLPRHLVLPRIGRVHTKEATDKCVRAGVHMLSATVSREADRWFVSLCVEVERPEPALVVGPMVGVDLGLTTFAVVSDGTPFNAPKPLTAKLKLLRRRSRQHSRKLKGSNNRKKAALRLARLHRKIRNTRNDFLHKLTTQLAKTKQAVVVEDLKVSSMLKNRRLARAISDVGWGEFRRKLTYKCQWYGAELIVAPRRFPSTRRCSSCSHVGPKLKLSERIFTCSTCGFSADRDFNASLNLLWYGQFGRNLTPAEIPPPAERKASRSTRRGSAKQEVNTTSNRQ